MVKRYLILEDGTVFEGEGFGAPAVTFGEVVFNTAMTGYQEIITNPIYHNQIVIFTQPNVGNSLIHSNVYESIEPPIKGVIVRNLANITAQKGRHRMTLDQYLNLINVPGITNVDTRALIRKLREMGVDRPSPRRPRLRPTARHRVDEPTSGPGGHPQALPQPGGRPFHRGGRLWP